MECRLYFSHFQSFIFVRIWETVGEFLGLYSLRVTLPLVSAILVIGEAPVSNK